MVISIGIFILLLVLYALINYLLNTLPVVEAGPISGVSSTGFKHLSYRINSSFTKRNNGVLYKYRNFIVRGNCMISRNIKPNDIIKVKMFDKNFTSDSIVSGDIVLIFLNDKKFRGYKIREVEKVYDKEAITFYYNAQGKKIQSSSPHSLEHIKGVVEL